MSRVREILDHYNIYYEQSQTKSDDLLILCPFHNDHNLGSASFNDGSEVFYCFSCCTGGNIYQFVAKMEDCSLKHAQELIDSNFEMNVSNDIFHMSELINKKIESVNNSIGLNKNYKDLMHKVVCSTLKHIKQSNDKDSILESWYPILIHFLYNKNAFTEREVIAAYTLFIKSIY